MLDRGTNRLVSFLRVLDLGLVGPWAVGKVLVAVVALDTIPG